MSFESTDPGLGSFSVEAAMPTLRGALVAVADTLRKAGIEQPLHEARLFAAAALGVSIEKLHALPLDQAIEPQAAQRLQAFVSARAARRPLAQVIGERAFWKHRFLVTPDVLDPRPETEILVAEALKRPFSRVLDLGTGSGAIVLSLLAERPEARGIGTDLCEKALVVARENARRLGLANRVEFQRANWFEGVDGRFDLIVSNPPYIPEKELATLAPEVRLYEPRRALTPGGDGLAAFRAIAAGAKLHLAPGGRVMVEFGRGQEGAVAAIFAAAGFARLHLVSDLDGRPRVVVVE